MARPDFKKKNAQADYVMQLSAHSESVFSLPSISEVASVGGKAECRMQKLVDEAIEPMHSHLIYDKW